MVPNNNEKKRNVHWKFIRKKQLNSRTKNNTIERKSYTKQKKKKTQ